MAPVARRLMDCAGVSLRLCASAQHREMLDDALRVFDLAPHYDLDIMRPGQTLSGVASAVLRELDPVLEAWRPDWMLVQGDTTTTMAAALAAFHRGIAVGHVEAGLRTGDLANPWPEEANRRIAGILARRHYCPTERAAGALRAEGVAEAAILVTGNTVVDALEMAVDAIDRNPSLRDDLRRRFAWIPGNRRLVLVTGHRRESFGPGFEQILLRSGAPRPTPRRPDRLSRASQPECPRPSLRGARRAPQRRPDRAAGLSRLRLVDAAVLSDPHRFRAASRRKPPPSASRCSSCARRPSAGKRSRPAARGWSAPMPTGSSPNAKGCWTIRIGIRR